MLDNFRSQYITWDTANKNFHETIELSQSDERGRRIVVQVLNGGQQVDLSGVGLNLYWETKDRHYHGLDGFTALDITKGKFELYVTTEMLTHVGNLDGSLYLVESDGSAVTSLRVDIKIHKGINKGAVESQNSFSALTSALAQVVLMSKIEYDAKLGADVNEEVKIARGIYDNLSERFKALTGKSASYDGSIRSLENKLDTMIATPADGVNQEEIIDARGTNYTLGERIDYLEKNTSENRKQVMEFLYRNGEDFTDITGGWAIANDTFGGEGTKSFLEEQSQMVLSYSKEGGPSRPVYFGASTQKKIDVTDIEAIYMIAEKASESDGAGHRTSFQLDADYGAPIYGDISDWRSKKYGIELFVIDTSGLTGEYYVSAHTGDNTSSTNYASDLIIHEVFYSKAKERSFDGVNKNRIPSYWDNHLGQKISKINGHQSDTGVNGTSFVFITDTHIQGNQQNSGALIEKIVDDCDIPYIIHGGDYVTGSGSASKQSIIDDIELDREMLKNVEHKVLKVEGNHDSAYGIDKSVSPYYYYAKNLTSEECYHYMFRMNSLHPQRHQGGNGTYFYQNDNVNKVRYIMLNSMDLPYGVGDDGYSLKKYNKMRAAAFREEQVKWFAEEALDVPSDEWSVVVASHIEPYSKDMYVQNGIMMGNILQTFKDKTSYSGSSESRVTEEFKTSISVDYTSKGGNVIAWLAGHMHEDSINRNTPSNISFNIVETLNDSMNQWGTAPQKIRETDTEQAFDVMTIDKKERKVYITRIGAGQDRVVHY